MDPKNNYCGLASRKVVLKDDIKMVLSWQSAMMDTELEVSLVPLSVKSIVTADSLSKTLPQTCH